MCCARNGEYIPERGLEEDLMEDIVRSKWFLIRAERNVMKAEARLAEMEPEEWSDADHKFLQLMLRYQTTRERSLQRAWRAFEQLRKDRFGEAAALLRIKQGLRREPPRKPKQEQVNPSQPKTGNVIVDRAERTLDIGDLDDGRAG
jgi:hypothetical protein